MSNIFLSKKMLVKRVASVIVLIFAITTVASSLCEEESLQIQSPLHAPLFVEAAKHESDTAIIIDYAGWSEYNHHRLGGAWYPIKGLLKNKRQVYSKNLGGEDWLRLWWHNGAWRMGHYYWMESMVHDADFCIAYCMTDVTFIHDLEMGTTGNNGEWWANGHNPNTNNGKWCQWMEH